MTLAIIAAFMLAGIAWVVWMCGGPGGGGDDSLPVCPKCGGRMESWGASGYDRHGREMEADWDECTKCGYQE